ncbi:energy transducer TonB [uncultured Pseudacidovorax sp.]|uniref:energy transducer TonB n=1 Tax=uncultured Pseudacidovorax sp. TaxID=679313 RepID=UPI00345C3F77
MKKLPAFLTLCFIFATGCATQHDTSKPTVIRSTPCPVAYPAEARANRWEGSALVSVLVESDGSVSEALIARSSGYEPLDQEALRLAKCMRYKPASDHGVSRAAWMELPFKFLLAR